MPSINFKLSFAGSTFTLGGVIIISVSDLTKTIIHDIVYLQIKWTVWGWVLFISSGLIWLLVLIPVQIKKAIMSRTFANQKTIPDEYWRICIIWNVLCARAINLPVTVIYFMGFKPI